MKIKGIVSEDFINYKKPSMFISFPVCSLKCDKENGYQLCQNMHLVTAPTLSFEVEEVVQYYLQNDITKAVVCGGLEPFDSFEDVKGFIQVLREQYFCDDDVVIYTGYNKEEIIEYIKYLKQFNNIIIKFGRFRPNNKVHFDEVLGVNLASDNQYAEKIS